jgi:hypothetical protein
MHTSPHAIRVCTLCVAALSMGACGTVDNPASAAVDATADSNRAWVGGDVGQSATDTGAGDSEIADAGVDPTADAGAAPVDSGSGRGSIDTLASDSSPFDSGPFDTGPADGGPFDTGPSDTGPFDTGPSDGGPFDTAPSDGGPFDTAPYDTAPYDTAPYDTAPYDTAPYDTAPYDTAPYDAGPYDAGPYDAGPYDAGPMDAPPLDGVAQICGDGNCAGGENCKTCPKDCGKCPTECKVHDDCYDQKKCTIDTCDLGKCLHTVIPAAACVMMCVIEKPGECKAGSYCDWPTSNKVGVCKGLGVCAPLNPKPCPAAGTKVCGCDQKTYASVCHAKQAGINVRAMGPCAGG